MVRIELLHERSFLGTDQPWSWAAAIASVRALANQVEFTLPAGQRFSKRKLAVVPSHGELMISSSQRFLPSGSRIGLE
jgi:hypothetical protein